MINDPLNDRARRDSLSSPTDALLSERERRYRTLFGAMEEGFCVIEMVFDEQGEPVDYRFLELNDAFTRMTGIAAEAALAGRTARELYPTLESFWFETYGRVANTGESIRFDSGAAAMGRWFEVHAFRIGGEESREVGILFKEISDRRAAENERERLLTEAKAREAFLHVVTDRLPVRVGYLGPDLRYRYMNGEYERAFGLAPGDGIGKSIVELAGEGPFRQAEPFLKRALAGEASFHAMTVDYAFGQRRVEVNYIPDKGAEGATLGLVVHVSDVTERYERERRLEDARARRDRALENAEVATFDWDVPNDQVWANGLLAQFFGISSDDAHGGAIAHYFAAIHAEDRDRVQAIIQASLATGERYETEYRVCDANGTVRQVLARGDTSLDAQGNPQRLTGVVLDVTARKRIDETLRERDRSIREARDLLESITEGTKEMIVSVDREYRFTFFNSSYQQSFAGVFGVEPSVGASVLETLAHLPEDRANAGAMFARSLAGESIDVTAEFGDPTLGRRTYDLRFYPIRDAEGRVVGAGEIARDVTERVEAERERERLLAQIAMERTRLESLFQTAPAAIAVLRGEDLRFEYMNGAYRRLFTKGEDVSGRPLSEVLPEACEQGFDELLLRVMATGEPFRHPEAPFILGGRPGEPSKTVYVDFVYQPIWEPDGTASGVFAHIIDVTAQVRARQAIAEREELFRTVFEQAPDDAILVMDRDRTIINWNPAAERIVGWSAKEAIGQTADVLFTSEDRASGAPDAEVRVAARDGKSADERWHLRKDGSRFWGSGTTNSLHDAQGAVRGYLKVFRDATERYEETQTLAFLSLLTEAVVDERDADRILATTQRMVGQYLGASRVTFGEFADDGEGFAVREEWGPDVPSVVGTYQISDYGDRAVETLRAGRPYVVRDAEEEFAGLEILDSLRATWSRAGITVPVLKEGRLSATVIVQQDAPREWTEDEIGLMQQVTGRLAAEIERARAEAALREANRTLEARVDERTQELQAAVREAEGFNYSISHDLRTPLRAIVSTASILLEEIGEDLDEEHRSMLVRQSENANRLGRLIDELLRLSRLSRVEVNRQPLDMSLKARSVFDELREHDVTNGCGLEVQPGMTAQGDPGLLRTVFHNLLSNACKFSPNGGTIRVGQEDGAFYVSDEGVGFDMRFAPKIFLPFERLVRESEFPGTGIGLANVERIVRRHGGRVWVESEPGKGTTFRFTLG